jgi:hypothetical protein
MQRANLRRAEPLAIACTLFMSHSGRTLVEPSQSLPDCQRVKGLPWIPGGCEAVDRPCEKLASSLSLWMFCALFAYYSAAGSATCLADVPVTGAKFSTPPHQSSKA